MWISLSSYMVSMTDGSFSRGPTSTARAIRSGLSTHGTSKLRQYKFDGLVDVRSAARGDSRGLFPGRPEHPVPVGRDLGFRRGQDFRVSLLCLHAERVQQFEGLPPRGPERNLSFPLRRLLRGPGLGLRFLDSLQRFRLAHEWNVRDNWATFKRFSYRLGTRSFCSRIKGTSHFHIRSFIDSQRYNFARPRGKGKEGPRETISKEKIRQLHNV